MAAGRQDKTRRVFDDHSNTVLVVEQTNIKTTYCLRHPSDIWFFLALAMHLRSGKLAWAALAGLAAGLGIFFETETGGYLLVTFLIYSVLRAGLVSDDRPTAGPRLAPAIGGPLPGRRGHPVPAAVGRQPRHPVCWRVLARMAGGTGKIPLPGS